MNIDNYIESQYREIQSKELLNPEFLNLYDSIENKKLKEIFASLHRQYVSLFKSMNERLPTRTHTAHFWADPSRDLIWTIDITMGLHRSLKNSKDEFEIDNYYFNLLKKCESFLSKSGGSILPENMEKVLIYYTAPIFSTSLSHKITRKDNEQYSSLKLIGEGSYAFIYKFRDESYNKDFALKRAKKDLPEKELTRFSREFEEMRRLSSPYILEVYALDKSRMQYTMEYMDFSLDTYIQKFASKLTPEIRRNLSFQILKAFSYLHSKNLIHRDISPKNILLKQYDDILVVKVSDFGLVKTPNSTLTSMNTEFKGYFNDPSLATEGFENYNILHETYALTKLLFYVMTGKTNTSEISDSKLSSFVKKGLNTDTKKRYQNIQEITDAFRTLSS